MSRTVARHDITRRSPRVAQPSSSAGGCIVTPAPTAYPLRMIFEAPHATKKQRKSSYKKTMDQVQSELSAPSRAFSKVIHTPAVEKTSDAIGGTIARPNALLAGAITATFLSLAVYLVARYYGYPLSQSESIIAFALGWALGIIYDYSRLMVRGRRG